MSLLGCKSDTCVDGNLICPCHARREATQREVDWYLAYLLVIVKLNMAVRRR